MLTFLIGIISGIISGMGMGGATILVVFLVLCLNLQQQVAQSINFVFYIPTAIVATLVHIKNKNVEMKPAIIIIIGALIGTTIGSLIAVRLPSLLLRRIFCVYLLIMGIYQILKREN